MMRTGKYSMEPRKGKIRKIVKMGGTVSETINNRMSGKYYYLYHSFEVLTRIILVIAFAVMLIPGRFFDCISSPAELDLIESYQVAVSPRKDGTLDIEYRLLWKVLDGVSAEELTWLRLGLGNADCEITGWGGDVGGCSRDGTYARVDLARAFGTGETAEILVSVHQGRMLCEDKKEPERPFFSFTPGWFDAIETKSYRFTWKESEGIISDNSDRREDGLLVWEGSLKKGERRCMELTYDAGYFDDPVTVAYKKSSAASGAPSGGDHPGKTLVLTVLGILFLIPWASSAYSRDKYERGKGFVGSTYRRTVFHGGGHRGCACAGCACACACAGGGRAGCSIKDYYDPEYNTPEITNSIKEYQNLEEEL